jgi:crotonobetainyl-CoA:carnitine CoA-transferase CaiB-like acyl-CoA transferase
MREGFIPAEDEHWIVIAIGTNEEWKAFCDVIGNPPWTKDPKFADQLSRWNNQDELDELVAQWTKEQYHYEAMHKLQEAGVAAGAVLNNREMLHDPHLNERGFWAWVYQRHIGLMPMNTVAWKFSKTPCNVFNWTPEVGEHNHYVLAELLGKSDEEIAKLYETGAIFGPDTYKAMFEQMGWQARRWV